MTDFVANMKLIKRIFFYKKKFKEWDQRKHIYRAISSINTSRSDSTWVMFVHRPSWQHNNLFEHDYVIFNWSDYKPLLHSNTKANSIIWQNPILVVIWDEYSILIKFSIWQIKTIFVKNMRCFNIICSIR